jgi:hypothetical protein
VSLPRLRRVARFPDAELAHVPMRDAVDVIEDFLLHLNRADREAPEIAFPRVLGLEVARLLKSIKGKKQKFQSEKEFFRFWVLMVKYRQGELVAAGMRKGKAAEQAAMEIAPRAKGSMDYRGSTERLVDRLLDGLSRRSRLPKSGRAKPLK